MRKLILAAVVVLLVMPAMAQNDEKFPSYVQVNGRAEKEITPDEFYLSIVINERDSKGKITVEQQQKEMTAALRGMNINIEKQLTMANMSSELFRRNAAVATAKYQLLLHSSGEVTKVYNALNDLGISNISILRVSNSKLEQYKNEVRIAAMQNAKQNATTLATAIGQKIGLCFYIYDSNYDATPSFYNNIAVMRSKASNDAMESATEEPLEFKTMKLDYNIQAKFVLE
ncbi:MAG: SIMPL domain-containing protein [Alistipes sp.]